MSAADKARNKADEIKGKVKKETGKAIDNEQMEAEGRSDEAKGDLKQAGEKIKDVFKD
ncbi:CsbD family protein [Actinoallomurus iriomotensis]|uniref:CsbD family protein n=1 Tax=Actinoallomurus iriomotensis TaxID=478107 RepID=A0A9W6W0T0_9ACTN|nr:CsbD family protein [Actinoallomurus iriomotensis]GLY86679.1 CsbD family protein [Actinoallomurus iriomotensis]